MPAEYKILADRNLVHITFSGVMTRSDVLRMRTALVTDAAYRAGLVEFIDTQSATDFEINYTGMLSIIRHYQQLFGAYGFPRCMVIYAPGDLGFGMARMYETMASDDIRFLPLLTQTPEETAQVLGEQGIAPADLVGLNV